MKEDKFWVVIPQLATEFANNIKEAETVMLVVSNGKIKEEQQIMALILPLLEEFTPLISEELPSESPPMWGFQHHIGLVSGSVLSNLPYYQMNPKEKEIRRQVKSRSC